MLKIIGHFSICFSSYRFSVYPGIFSSKWKCTLSFPINLRIEGFKLLELEGTRRDHLVERYDCSCEKSKAQGECGL